MSEPVCAIEGCGRPAAVRVTMLHPNPACRWSADLCHGCAMKEHEKHVEGELSFSLLDMTKDES